MSDTPRTDELEEFVDFDQYPREMACLARQLERELDEALRNLAIQLEVYEHQQSQLTSHKAALEKAGVALESCRMVVQNKINVCEALKLHTEVWPDLLTGCVSGGGIMEALNAINELKDKE